MLLDFRVAAMVAEFMARCPDVQVHLEATDRRVDVIAEGFDLAIRVRPPPLEDSDLVMRVLASRRQCLVASPRLMARLGQPDTPEALLKRADNATIVITHYQRLLDYIVPDFVHVLYDGRIVKTGDKNLALELEEKGYDWIKQEVEAK